MRNGTLGAAVIALKEGVRHIKAYHSHSEVELLMLCDTDEQLLAERQTEFKVPCGVADYRQILENPEVDIVSVTSPDYYHAEQAIAALRAGKHVLCEKPMTLTLADAEAIVQAVQETGQIFMTGHPTRFTPAFMLARKMIKRGDIGELFMVESEYAHNYTHARGKNDWRVDARRDPLIGGGCHAVDLIRWIADADINEAFAYANHKCLGDWPVNDTYMSLFKFSTGVIGKVMCSIGVVRPYTMRSVFYGTEGTIICDNMSATLQVSSRRNSSRDEFCPDFATVPVLIDHHNVIDEVSDLVNAIVRDKPITADVVEGAKTVAACVAAVESARLGQAVKVKNKF